MAGSVPSLLLGMSLFGEYVITFSALYVRQGNSCSAYEAVHVVQERAMYVRLVNTSSPVMLNE